MSCLYANFRSWPRDFDDERLQNTHKVQHEIHNRVEYLKYSSDQSKWHGQATYNLAVRQEMRKRGFAVRMS